MSGDLELDRAMLQRIRESMGGDFTRLVDIFIKSTEETLDSIETAYLRQDLRAFVRHTHNLKSNAANLGGRGLSEQARDLEQQALDGALPADDEFIGSLRAAFAVIRAELNQAGHY